MQKAEHWLIKHPPLSEISPKARPVVRIACPRNGTSVLHRNLCHFCSLGPFCEAYQEIYSRASQIGFTDRLHRSPWLAAICGNLSNDFRDPWKRLSLHQKGKAVLSQISCSGFSALLDPSAYFSLRRGRCTLLLAPRRLCNGSLLWDIFPSSLPGSQWGLSTSAISSDCLRLSCFCSLTEYKEQVKTIL